MSPKYYTLAEVQAKLQIASTVLYRKINVLNIEIRRLPGSRDEYLTASDVQLVERSIKEPEFRP